jgi:hypothetical protein
MLLFKTDYKIHTPGGKDGRCVGLTTLPPSCAECLEILEPQPPGTPRAWESFTFIFIRCIQNTYIQRVCKTHTFCQQITNSVKYKYNLS